MSLKVWLPLNGDLRNYGSDGAIFTKATNVWGTGKIGSQALLTSTGTGNVMVEGLKDKQEFSIAYWVKVDSSLTYSTWQDIWALDYVNASGTFPIRDEHTNTAGNHQLIMAKETNVGSNTYNYISMTIANAANTWQHIVLVKGLTQTMSYLNGELKMTRNNTDFETSSGKLSGNVRIGAATCGAYLNDIRIYDHCLSAAEVREISQGLVLHYKLDGGLFGNTNLLLNTHFDNRYNQTTGWDTTKNGTLLANNWGGYNSGVANASTCYHAHLKLFQDEYVYEYIKDTENWLGISQGGLQTKLTAGKTYTFSCEQYSVTNTNYMYGGLYYFKTGASSASFHLGYIYCNTNRQQGQWQKFTYTFTAPSDGDYSKNMSWYCYGHNGGAGTFYLRHLKLEEGSVATLWCPADSELTIDRTHIQDSSGYGHNGTILGSPIISSDTARYTSSTNFPANADGILSTYPIALWNNAFTYSFWIKPSGESGGRSIYAASYNGTSCSIEKTTGNKLRFYWNGSPDLSTSSLTIVDGAWQHITVVKEENKTTVKCYYNGVLKDTFTNTFSDKTFSGNLRIARDTRGDATSYTGMMSDFRIYCTALDADAIRQLYEVGAKVDNLGNWHTFEFKENGGIAKVIKTGITAANEVYDNMNFNNRAQIVKNNATVLIAGDLNIITTYSSSNKTGTIASLPATTVQSLAGKTLRLIYDVCTLGDRYSTEQGQTAYNYTRYGIHGSCTMDSSTSYPFAGELNYNGNSKHTIQTWTIPTGKSSYGALSFAIQNFDKPSSTNNATWFIRNVRLEVIDGTSDNITGTQLIER